jgi:glycosyltransferase involved in cell wall biosynthesis
MTDNLGQSQVIPYLAGLAEKGHKITVLSFEKKYNFQRSEEKIKELLRVSAVNWVPLKYHLKPPVISTVFDVIKLKSTVKKLHETEKFDIIHCRSYISAFAGLYLKKKTGVNFVFDMRGFWADERIDGKIWSLRNPLYRIIYNYFKRKEKKFLTNADHIISLTEKGREEIHSWKFIKNQPVPIKVIPCCADMELFNYKNVLEDSIQKKKTELGFSENSFIISYLGSIGTWYMLDEMLDFFKVLISKKPNSRFFFISGDDEEFIKGKAESLGISRQAIVVKKADRYEVPLFLSLCDISIFFIKPVFSKKASSPTKMGEIMSLGKPYICNSGVGDVDLIVNESKTGVLVGSFDEKSYATAVSEIDKIILLDPEYIRSKAEKYYSLKNGVERYNDVYNLLIK